MEILLFVCQVCCPIPNIQHQFLTKNTVEHIDLREGRQNSKLPQPGECGVIAFSDRPVVGGFIVGGDRTRLNEAPW